MWRALPGGPLAKSTEMNPIPHTRDIVCTTVYLFVLWIKLWSVNLVIQQTNIELNWKVTQVYDGGNQQRSARPKQQCGMISAVTQAANTIHHACKQRGGFGTHPIRWAAVRRTWSSHPKTPRGRPTGREQHYTTTRNAYYWGGTKHSATS